MAKTVAQLEVQLRADFARFRQDMQQAGRETRAAARQMSQSMTEARGGIMLLGEELGVRLPRHLQKFVAGLPGVAPLMSAAFSTIAVVGLGVAAFEAGKKVYEIVKSANEAKEKMSEAFRTITEASRLANDELALTNDKLRVDIATLEHKPTNNLAIALDEARVAADKLGQSAVRSAKAVAEMLEKNKVSLPGAIMTGQATTSDATGYVNGLEKQYNDIIRQAAEKIRKAKTPKEAEDLNKKLYENLNTFYDQSVGELGSRSAGASKKYNGLDVTATQGIYGDYAELLKTRQDFDRLTQENQGLSKQDKLDHDKKNAGDEAKKAAAEAARKQREVFDSEFKALKADHAVGLQEEEDYWIAKLKPAQAFAENYRYVLDKVNEYLAQGNTEIERLQKQASDQMASIAATARKKDDEDTQAGMERFARAQSERLRPWLEAQRAMQQDVANRVYGPGNRVDQLQQELALINGIADSDATRLSKEAAIEQINREMHGIYSEQLMASGTAGNGVRAFFNDMVNQARTAAQTMYDLMRSAFEGVNEQLSRMITGQKANWGQFFQSIGQQVAHAGLEKLETTVVGMIMGKQAAGKKDGYHVWVDNLPGSGLPSAGGKDANASTNPLSGIMSKITSSLSGIFSKIGSVFSSIFGSIGKLLGGMGGGFGGIISSLFGGHLASGGEVLPGMQYDVGEMGRERFTSSVPGHITRAGDSKRGGALYYIDARGANAADTEARVQRSLAMVHGSAVAVSYQTVGEMARRRPLNAVNW